MKATCSIRDVANYTNVAPSTVSRVLNNRMGTLHVAPETRERILAAARELNYTPNIHAKRLFSRRSNVIALVLPAFQKRGSHVFQDIHLVEFFSGMERALMDTDYRLLIIFNDCRFAEQKEYLSLFRERSIDGMLVWGACDGETFWPEVAAEKKPVLFLTNPPCDRNRFNFILHDYAAAARGILAHLLARGHRKIGWIGGYRENGTTLDQERGIAEAAAGCPELELFRAYGDFRAPEAAAACEELLEKHSELTAIMISNVSAAEGVKKALNRRGTSPPVAIAACDCVGTVEASDITRMMVDDFSLGRNSVTCLLELLNGSRKFIREFLPVEFRQGSTT